ncbi:DUF3365 domain-containing protein [Leptospira fluminis]|uniref:DUF3365 domain-containing protein n=1 Tax=Leptospira fluminis TaxID=2484979 RepID=A0A4R9GRF6_9LEPT|nr:DUF3365 domain-containing protein [Leptospira fluminis]TGK20728.1 DUF3365 domain-containing protein [Leptospira fluminis]
MKQNKSALFRKLFLRGISLLILVQFFAVCDRNQDGDKKEILSKLFDELQAELSKELRSSIRTRGLADSISICKTLSPSKEKEIGDRYPGLRIRRVSEKNRNPQHSPDDWEKQVFADWKKFAETGRPPYSFFESTQNELRAMRPISISDETCLKCHGPTEKIDGKTLAKIRESYPNDAAVNYKMGDLRGAFSATWKRF